MADNPQQPQQTAPQRAAPPRKSFIGRLASSIAAHAYLSLAMIIVLVILVIGLYVYYHGFLFLGPYAKGKSGFASKRSKKGGAAGEEAGPDAQGDPETERLIDTINHQ